MKDRQEKRWHKGRHTFFQRLLQPFAKLFFRVHYGFTYQKVALPEGPVLLLCNHVCDADPFFVLLAVKKPVYPVAMDDLTSRKKLGPLLRFCFNPIPIAKGTSDIRAVMNIMRVRNEGHKILMFPEANRTYDGKLCHIQIGTVKLIKKLGAPVAFFNIHGGYGADPRWGAGVRKGRTSSSLRYLMRVEEVNALSEEELAKKVDEYLDVDNLAPESCFKSKNKAHYLERVLFRCPDCGAIGSLHSKGDDISCEKCGYQETYQENLRFRLVKGKTHVETVADWCALDRGWLTSLKMNEDLGVIFHNEHFNLYKTFTYDPRETVLEDCEASAYWNRLEFSKGEKKVVLRYDDLVDGCPVAKHKSNLYFGKQAYQIEGKPNDNTFKYVMLFYHYKNQQNNIPPEEEFLGI